ncbi:hypothetical protein [Halobacteriovorax sp. HLS]|uniref:hypothetical protein n=1 Tax=Halobacteriovorax sp. HLS TaxID=2234000 RepID=UPI000FD93CC7|nr:hypothetical protein [Halobacteriovorax sp. HLS]
MKKLFFILCLLFQSSIFSKDADLTIEQIEQIFTTELKNAKKSKTETFQIYNLVARELYNYNYFEKSKEYYEKAIKLNVSNADLTEAYINLMAIDHALDKKVSKSSYDKTMAYFKKSGKIKDAGIERYMKFIESNFINKTSSMNYEGFYGQYSKDTSIKSLVEKKSYKEALSLINGSNIETRDINTKIKYDILRGLVIGKKKFPLACEEVLNKYPNSFSWRMKTCKVLIQYQNKKVPSKDDIAGILSSLKKDRSESMVYLVNALEDLK